MTTKEISELPVKDICTHAAVLYLWVTAPKLQDGLYVLNEWGFEYKTNLVWVKEFEGLGLGYWSRCRHEHLLIGTRGKLPYPEPKVKPENVIPGKRGKHSEKPVGVYRIIEKAYPTLKKIVLFARKDRKGGKGGEKFFQF